MDIRGHLGCHWQGAEDSINAPKGPQPYSGTRNKRAKRAVFLVVNNSGAEIAVTVHPNAIQMRMPGESRTAKTCIC